MGSWETITAIRDEITARETDAERETERERERQPDRP